MSFYLLPPTWRFATIADLRTDLVSQARRKDFGSLRIEMEAIAKKASLKFARSCKHPYMNANRIAQLLDLQGMIGSQRRRNEQDDLDSIGLSELVQLG
jgi:hypothetical protein